MKKQIIRGLVDLSRFCQVVNVEGGLYGENIPKLF
jgi:hypothetical protein